MCTSGYGHEFLLCFFGTSVCNFFPHFFRGGLQNKMPISLGLSFFETPHICILVFYYALWGEKNENLRLVLHLVKPKIMGFLHELGGAYS
jgi:hypothetical protein